MTGEFRSTGPVKCNCDIMMFMNKLMKRHIIFRCFWCHDAFGTYVAVITMPNLTSSRDSYPVEDLIPSDLTFSQPNPLRHTDGLIGFSDPGFPSRISLWRAAILVFRKGHKYIFDIWIHTQFIDTSCQYWSMSHEIWEYKALGETEILFETRIWN